MRRFLAVLLVLSLMAPAAAGIGAASPQGSSGQTAGPVTFSVANETPNGTATANNSTTSGNPSEPKQVTKNADLYVEQPRHVGSSVEKVVDKNGITYTVNGRVLELEPQNFDPENVVKAAVREDAATLKFDKAIGRYVLDTQGIAGTYRVMFRTRTDGQYTTYTATIKVQQASYAHVAPSKLDSLEEKAEQYDWVVTQFASADLLADDADPERVEAVIEDAVTWYMFYDNPLSGLSGQFLSFGIMLIKWPAGWVILSVIFTVAFWRYGSTKKENRKLKRQFADIENIDESKREAQERELKRVLSMQTFQDLGLTDSDAQAVKEHCGVDNPRQFLDQFREYMTPTHTVGLLLGAYEQLGHAVSVTREGGHVVDAELVEDAAVPDGGVAAESSEAYPGMGGLIKPTDADEEVIGALDWDALSPDVLWNEEVDASKLDLPVNNDAEGEGHDLVDEFGVPVGEDGTQYHIIERREEFVDILVQIVEEIAASEFTDEEGKVRPEADMLDFLYTFSAVNAERYRESLWDVRDVLLRTRQMLDAGERMTDLAERSKQNELGSDRQASSGGGDT